MPTFKEWGPSCPHTYLGSYRLEADMSWTVASNVEERDREMSMINQILNGDKTLAAAIEVEQKSKMAAITFN